MEATYELEPQFLSIQDEERVGGLEEAKKTAGSDQFNPYWLLLCA